MLLGEAITRKRCTVFNGNYVTTTEESATIFDGEFNLLYRLLKSPKCPTFTNVVHYNKGTLFLSAENLLMLFVNFKHIGSINMPGRIIAIIPFESYYGILTPSQFSLVSLNPNVEFKYAIKWDKLNVSGTITKAIYNNQILYLSTARRLYIIEANSIQAEDWSIMQVINLDIIDFHAIDAFLAIVLKSSIIQYKLENNQFVEYNTISLPHCKQVLLSNDLKYLVCLFKSHFHFYLLPNFKLLSSEHWVTDIDATSVQFDAMHLVLHCPNKSIFFPIAKTSFELTPLYYNSLFPCILSKYQLFLCTSVQSTINIPNGSHFIPISLPFQLIDFNLLILNTKDLLFLSKHGKLYVYSKANTTWQEIDFKCELNSFCFLNNSLVCLLTDVDQFLIILDFNKPVNLEHVPRLKMNFKAIKLDFIKPYLYVFSATDVTVYSWPLECLFSFPLSSHSSFIMNHFGPTHLAAIKSQLDTVDLQTWDLDDQMHLTSTSIRQIKYTLLGLGYFPIFTDLFSHCYCLLGPGKIKIFCMINRIFEFELEYDLHALPIAVDIQKGLILLVELEASRVFVQDAPLIKFISITHPFIHVFAFQLTLFDPCLLANYLDHFKSSKQFQHYLELILMYFYNQQNQELLILLIDTIKSFECFYEVVVKVARKLEQVDWLHLFELIGQSPQDILHFCLNKGDYRIASQYLILSDVDVMITDCIALLKGALDVKDLQLSREIMDYINKIGSSVDLQEIYRVEIKQYFSKYHNVNDLFDRHCLMLMKNQQYSDLYETIMMAEDVDGFIQMHTEYFDLKFDVFKQLIKSFRLLDRRGSEVKNSKINKIIEVLKDTDYKRLLIMMYAMVFRVEEIKVLLTEALKGEFIEMIDLLDIPLYNSLKDLIMEEIEVENDEHLE